MWLVFVVIILLYAAYRLFKLAIFTTISHDSLDNPFDIEYTDASNEEEIEPYKFVPYRHTFPPEYTKNLKD